MRALLLLLVRLLDRTPALRWARKGRAWLDQRVDPQVRQLRTTVRLMRRGGIDVLFIADSSATFYAPDDVDKSRLPQMLQRELGSDLKVHLLAGAGYHPRIHAELVRILGTLHGHFANIAPDSQSVGDISAAAEMDAHRMPYESGSFDHVIGHSGLHHCSRPHEALHEMYRIARKTVLFVENQDSAMMRLATRAGVVSWHELPAVVDGGYESGGVDGTGVPNFVYRWTRRELRKAVAAFDPAYDVPVEFHTEWNLGTGRVASAVLQRKLRLSNESAEKVFTRGQRLLNKVAARQGNIVAATIRKDLATLHPWMASPTEMRRS